MHEWRHCESCDAALTDGPKGRIGPSLSILVTPNRVPALQRFGPKMIDFALSSNGRLAILAFNSSLNKRARNSYFRTY